MNKINEKHIPLNSYIQAVSVLTDYARIILSSYDNTSTELRDTIIMNFMARSVTSLRGILHLWRTQDFHDCWVLYRSILDRLFHLETICRDDSVEAFDNWCFKNSYNYKMKCLNDPEIAGKINEDNLEYFTPSQEDEKRYSELNQENTNWRRPKAEEVATKMNLDFLYHYGYDFASRYVHPTSKEGQEDFSRLTNKPMGKSYDDQITVIHNSCIATSIIFRQGLFFSRMLWIAPVIRFPDEFIEFINRESDNYLRTMSLIFQRVRRNLPLCKTTNQNE